jgi:hypothetical protein
MKYILFVFLFANAVTMETQNAPQWKQEEKTDAFRGTSYMQFSLEGKFLTPPQRRTLPDPLMVVRCVPGNGNRGHTRGKYISGYIATGTVMDTSVDSGGNSSVVVQFRLDDGKIQTVSWGRSTDFSAIFLTPPAAARPFLRSGYEEFANLLYGHAMYHKENTSPQVRKVVLDVPEYLGGEIVMRFDLPDATGVADACGIIWHK